MITDQLFVTLYIYLSLGKPTAAPISPEPFSTHTLYMERNYITKTILYLNYTKSTGWFTKHGPTLIRENI